MGIVLDLPIIWAFIIAFAVFAYVVMDGFDLGHRHPVSVLPADAKIAT